MYMYMYITCTHFLSGTTYEVVNMCDPHLADFVWGPTGVSAKWYSLLYSWRYSSSCTWLKVLCYIALSNPHYCSPPSPHSPLPTPTSPHTRPSLPALLPFLLPLLPILPPSPSYSHFPPYSPLPPRTSPLPTPTPPHTPPLPFLLPLPPILAPPAPHFSTSLHSPLSAPPPLPHS